MSISHNEISARHHRALGANIFDDPTLEAHYPPDLELEPIHLDIDLDVDLAGETVKGTVTNTIKARRDGPRTITLHAVDFAELSVGDLDGNDLAWDYDGEEVTITWAEPFAAGEERRAAVAYRVTGPTAGLYFSQPDDAYPDAPWFAASDHETERARHWLPCLDLPNVRTTLDFHLRAEERFTVLANGYLVEENTHDDGTKTAHWRLEQLCPSYLVCIAIGDFVRADDGTFDNDGEPIELAYFCSSYHQAADLKRTFGRTGAMLEWMTEKLGMAFPYPKYYQFALPGIGGAMENISLVSWTDRAVCDETLHPEFGWFIDQVNVHEMAHSYFGDAIVCRDFAHAWLKESWATYTEQLWREDQGVTDEAQYVYFKNAEEYFEEADERYQRPIVTRRFKSSWDLYDSHTYEGGGCRLHTLRCELGDEVFWAAVRDYLQRYNGKVVETDDFRAVMEEHSGRSLGKFFDQWFYQAGYPDLKVSFEYDEEREQGLFTIEQKQVKDDGDKPTFELSTALAWEIDGEMEQMAIKIDETRHVFVVPMHEKPIQVRFDPDHEALHKLAFNPGGPMLRRQLTAAPDAIGRIQAAHELAKTSKRNNIEAILEAYPQEPFWGVRREMARVLGKANHETAVAGLPILIAQEEEPIVLAVLMEAAGEYRDDGIREAVMARLDEGLPPNAARAAYETLGKQRNAAPYDLLAEAAEKDSFNGLAQSGALRGLGASRQERAISFLQEKSAYGALSNRARPAAAAALGQIGKGQEKRSREQIGEHLIDLLRDPWPPVAWSAATALKTMQVPQAIDPLQAFGKAHSAQEETAVQRMIKAIRREDKVDGSALQKQVEQLEEKVRKLEEALQAVQARAGLLEEDDDTA